MRAHPRQRPSRVMGGTPALYGSKRRLESSSDLDSLPPEPTGSVAFDSLGAAQVAIASESTSKAVVPSSSPSPLDAFFGSPS